ncbi:hypothetical protein PENTCL1PPCAC_9103, partial [Pristionchus entomophagus]
NTTAAPPIGTGAAPMTASAPQMDNNSPNAAPPGYPPTGAAPMTPSYPAQQMPPQHGFPPNTVPPPYSEIPLNTNDPRFYHNNNGNQMQSGVYFVNASVPVIVLSEADMQELRRRRRRNIWISLIVFVVVFTVTMIPTIIIIS